MARPKLDGGPAPTEAVAVPHHPEDDDTPIRRLTKRPSGVTWRHPAVFVPVGLLTVSLIVAVAVLAGRDRRTSTQTGTPPPVFNPLGVIGLPGAMGGNAEGVHLLAYSKWWSPKATPEKIQALVNDCTKNAGLVIYFNQDADYTRVYQYSVLYAQQRYGEIAFVAVKQKYGGNTEYHYMIAHAKERPDEFSNPSVVDSGRSLQIRAMSFDRRPTVEEAVQKIEDNLATQKPVEGSGRTAKLRD